MSFQQEMDQAIKEKRLYFIGQSLPPDWYAAVIQWTPMAEAGDPKAQFNLGRCFSRGDGIDQDNEKARYWLEKAASQNDPRAIYNLSILFAEKNYPDRDESLSEQYFSKAIELNEPRALNVLEKRKSNEIELINKRKAEELEQIRSQKLASLKEIIATIQKAIDEKNLYKAKKLVVKETKENPDFTYGETISAILNLDLSYEFSSHTTSEGHSFMLDGSTRYQKFNTLHKQAKVTIKNKSKTELVGCSLRLTRSDSAPYPSPAVTLKPGEQTVIRSEDVTISNERVSPIEGVVVSFPLRSPLDNAMQPLVIYFENPIEFKDTRLGFFSYLIIFLVIIGLIASSSFFNLTHNAS